MKSSLWQFQCQQCENLLVSNYVGKITHFENWKRRYIQKCIIQLFSLRIITAFLYHYAFTSKGVIMSWFFSPCILIQIRFCTTLTTNGQISLELSKLGKLKICIVQGSKAQVSFCCPFVIFSYCILSSLEPLGQLQPNLAQSFQFILFFWKNEGPDPFKRRDNYQRWEDIEITIIYRLMLF